MQKLRELRDKAASLNQMSAAGELMGFYVKQIATGDVDDFSRMTDAEPEAFVYGNKKPAKPKH